MNRRAFFGTAAAIASIPAVGMAGTVKVELGEKIEQEWDSVRCLAKRFYENRHQSCFTGRVYDGQYTPLGRALKRGMRAGIDRIKRLHLQVEKLS